MKVEDNNSAQISRLVQQQRNLVSAKEAEIENVRQLYDQKKENERLIGQADVIEVRDINQREILDASTQKSERLQKMHEQLQKDLQRLENERALISDQTKLIREDGLAKQLEAHENASSESLNFARDIGRQTSQNIADLQKESQWQVAEASQQASKNYQTQERLHENHLAQTMQQQRLQLATKEIEHAQKLNQLESDFRRDSARIMSTSAAQQKAKSQELEKNQEQQRIHYDNLLNSKKAAYERKLAQQAKQYEEVLANTKELFAKQLNQLHQSYSKNRSEVETKAQDPFYTVERLSATIEETPKHYLVHLPIPEHEAENVLVSARDRTIKMTFSRRFSQRVEAEDGHVDINKRSESFSQEMPVAHLTSSAGITRKYENGILTFLINKA